MYHRVAAVFILFLCLATAGAASGFVVNDGDHWLDGTFTNTTVQAGDLEVIGTNLTGTYTSRIFDGGDRYRWKTVSTVSDLDGASAELTVSVSDDDFSTTLDTDTVSISDGTDAVNVSLSPARYVRFNYTITKTGGAQDPELTVTNISTQEDVYFFIRDRPCYGDEESLFSMSNRSNAHAGTPGYYDYTVCARGLKGGTFRSYCTRSETAVLSFFDADKTYVHLSTDEDLWDQKVCTGELTVGVRDTCPATTKAIASIYSLPESHVAPPGHYGHQLCGAFFTDATLMMQFQLSGDDTVYFNDTQDPDTGVYRSERGFRSPAIVAEGDELVAGIISGERTNTSAVGYDTPAGDSLFNVTQRRNRQLSYFLPFTDGDHETILDRQGFIQNADFLSQVNPNFAYNFLSRNLLRVSLELTTIDLVSNLALAPGAHTLLLEQVGTANDGRTQVRVNVTAP